ncbi:hypothetical protein OOK58_58090 [Streptomyces sp. NBC_01728]|uniref:hypothetical protein n=1 Tax=unclassified Streptomyces TaxID=2593676 RepID=UPI002253AF03|nr:MULTISPECIES: hypothetical protein [unclassified Streptomyces]MCX4462231.1 hypothetical protein [Streptomyces sp. NBC_01719]MCX4500669.1 hypothetical protein [Streptomyces sp. NBC_01728]MCX4598831.1 hypothetical protein [Streptomyces sp. NBC_01549]
MSLIVEATVDRAVILTKLEVRVESRAAPPFIDDISLPPPAAPMARRELRTFQVNLSDPTPVLRPNDGVSDFPYTVSHLDPERFLLQVNAGGPGDVVWSVNVHWLCNGRTGVVIADNEGQPFRLVTSERRDL